MQRNYIYLLILISLVTQRSEGSQGYYISPYVLGKAKQFHDALEKIEPNLTVARTVYNIGGISYSVDNFTGKYTLNDDKQTADIFRDYSVTISGGRIQIQSRIWKDYEWLGQRYTLYYLGSVLSDSLNYTKMLAFLNDVFRQYYLGWCLASGERSFTNLKITSLILIQKSKYIMPVTLNRTLNFQILSSEIVYKYQHPVKGRLSMTIIHRLYYFALYPDDGYRMIFLTDIKGSLQSICNGETVPLQHLSWEQLIWRLSNYSFNLPLPVSYSVYAKKKHGLMQNQTLIGTVMLFSSMLSIYTIQSIIFIFMQTQDNYSKDNAKLAKTDQVQNRAKTTLYNTLQMDVTYNCIMRTTDKTYKYIDVMNFIADVKLSIEPKAEKTTLDFSIVDIEVINMIFKPVGQYYVGNVNLARLKTNQILHQLIGTKVFGSGFPSLARDFPQTEVNEDYIVYYDLSHKARPSFAEQHQI